jgi:ketosteroid isomerase-like protein
MKRALVLVMIGIVCAMCLACLAGTTGLTEQDKAAIRKADEAMHRTAFSEKHDWTAFAAEAYAQDAELLSPDEPRVAGLDAIKTWYADWPRFKEFTVKEVRLEGSGGFAYRHIAYIATPLVPVGTQPETSEGKDIAVLRKEPDGTWKTISECWNANAPPSDIIVPTAAVATDASGELKKLADIVGRWKFDGTWKSDPKAATGPVDLEFTCTWFAGGHQVVYRLGGTIAGIAHEELGVYTYDPAAKAYAEYNISSVGGGSAPGVVTIQPGTWLHVYDVRVGGKPAKAHFTLSNMSPAGGDWKYVVSVGGGPWTVLGEGKYVKAK